MRKVLSRLSLKVSVPLLLTAPVLVVVPVLSTLAFIQSRSTAKDLVSRSLTQIHERIGEKIDALLAVPRRITQLNEALLRQGTLEESEPRSWREVFFQEMASHEELSAVTWGSRDRKTTWIARYPGQERLEYVIQDQETGDDLHVFDLDENGIPERTPKNTFPFDPRQRPWYRAAAEAGRPTWSEVYAWIQSDGTTRQDDGLSTLGMAYTIPHFDEAGELFGVVDADVSLHDLSKFLRSLNIAETGSAVITDADGRLIATSMDTPLTDADDSRLTASKSKDPLLAAAAGQLRSGADEADRHGGAHQTLFKHEGETYLIKVSALTKEPGLDWFVATLVPERDFMEEVEAIRSRTLLLGILAVILALGLGVLLAVRMVHPFLSLASQVRRIAQGDLKEEVRIDASPEFTLLSDEINLMTGKLRDRERMKSELKIANQIQMAMLPGAGGATVSQKGWSIAAVLIPARSVGGDFYDFFSLADGRLCVLVGDVSDKGIPAALFMARTVTLVKVIASEATSSAAILSRLNQELCRENDACMFVTIVCCIFDPGSGELILSNGGHNPPLRLGGDHGARYVGPPPGGVLGLNEEATYQDMTLHLEPGETLLLYTDGVTEAQNDADELYEEERLLDQVRKAASREVRELAHEILDSLRAFTGSAPQNDDITILGLSVSPAPRPEEETEGGPAIEIERDPTQLPGAVEWLRDSLATAGLSEAAIDELAQPVRDLIANLVRQKRESRGENRITIRVTPREDEVQIALRDPGPPSNLLEPSDLLEDPLGDTTMVRVKRAFDRVEYVREKSCNVVIVVKHRDR
jgi:sigma-B regulation protein RsbU (phosphoserine phosphatase)